MAIKLCLVQVMGIKLCLVQVIQTILELKGNMEKKEGIVNVCKKKKKRSQWESNPRLEMEEYLVC